MGGDEGFIDRIYEASIITELWPKVLVEVSQAAEAKDALLIISSGANIRAVGSSSHFENLCSRHYEYPGGHERTRRLIAQQRSGFVRDSDVYTEREILGEPLFEEFMIPRGYGSGVATSIQMPSGESIIFHAERAYSAGPFSEEIVRRLDSIRPHLARSSLLSARLGLERARAVSAALEAVGLPAAMLDLKGCILSANTLLDSMIPEIVQDRSARVTLASPMADMLLKAAIENLPSSSRAETVCSIPIPADERHPPVIIHLLPVKGAARDVFFHTSFILIVTPMTAKKVPGASVLQGLFDFTASEARIAHEVGNGRTVNEIADALGITVTTVRNQIAAVLAKSGLRRRVDLVALLQGAMAGSLN